MGLATGTRELGECSLPELNLSLSVFSGARLNATILIKHFQACRYRQHARWLPRLSIHTPLN